MKNILSKICFGAVGVIILCIFQFYIPSVDLESTLVFFSIFILLIHVIKKALKTGVIEDPDTGLVYRKTNSFHFYIHVSMMIVFGIFVLLGFVAIFDDILKSTQFYEIITF